MIVILWGVSAKCIFYTSKLTGEIRVLVGKLYQIALKQQSSTPMMTPRPERMGRYNQQFWYLLMLTSIENGRNSKTEHLLNKIFFKHFLGISRMKKC